MCTVDRSIIEKHLYNKFPQWQLQEEGRITKEVVTQLDQYFNGSRKEFTSPTSPIGTEFQKKVWEGLKKIPFGETKSYSQLSLEILGHTRGARAIGQANSKNPIAIIVPCHRVINKAGDLGGYRGGIDIKKWLINWEANSR